jgi:hypothetical protein
MAGEGSSPTEMKAHERDYSKFIAMIKWGTIVSFVTGAVVVLIIAA